MVFLKRIANSIYAVRSASGLVAKAKAATPIFISASVFVAGVQGVRVAGDVLVSQFEKTQSPSQDRASELNSDEKSSRQSDELEFDFGDRSPSSYFGSESLPQMGGTSAERSRFDATASGGAQDSSSALFSQFSAGATASANASIETSARVPQSQFTTSNQTGTGANSPVSDRSLSQSRETGSNAGSGVNGSGLIAGPLARINSSQDSSDSSKAPSENNTAPPASLLPVTFRFDIPNTIIAGTCVPLILDTVDDSGVQIPSSQRLLVRVTGLGTGQLFADSSCSNAMNANQITILGNIRSSTYYYRNTLAETVTLLAEEQFRLVQKQNASVSVVAAPGRQFSLSGATQTLAGQCLGPILGVVKDEFGNLTTTTAQVLIDLASDPDVLFYDSADCSGAALSQLSVPGGSAQFSFSLKSSRLNSNVVSLAPQTELDANSYSIQVGPSQIVASMQAVARSGDCVPVDFRFRDEIGTFGSLLNSAQVEWESSASTLLFATSDSTCAGSPLTRLQFDAGSNLVSLFMRPLASGSLSVQMNDVAQALASVSASASIGPRSLRWSGPNIIAAGTCALFTLETVDSQDAIANTLSTLSIALSDGTSLGGFYSAADSNCTGAQVNSLSIVAGGSSAQVRYRNLTAEISTIIASDASNVILPAERVLTTAPGVLNIIGPVLARASDCVAFQVQSEDFEGNASPVLEDTTVNFSDGVSSGVFYAESDSACTGAPLASVFLPTGAVSAGFRYRSTAAVSAILNADDQSGEMMSGTHTLNIGPDRLDLAGPTPIRAGDCTAYTITSRDTDLTAANVLGLTTVNLTDDTATGEYFSDAACTTSITQTSIASGSNNRTVYYRDPVKENVVLTASDAAGSLTLASDTLSVAVGPRSIHLTGASPVLSGTCQLYTVTIRDFAGTESGVLSETTVTLTDGTAQGVFYAAADTSCSGGSIGSLALAIGGSTAQFRYRDPKAEAVSLSASDGGSGLDDATLAVTVGPDRLDLTGPTPIRAGDCTAYTITSRDTDLTAANVLGLTTVNLTDDTTTGGYFSDAACTTSITQTTIGSGSNSRTVYYRDSVKENVVLTASDAAGSLTLASDTLSVAVGPRSIHLTGASPVLSGTCQLYTVTIRDFAGTESGVLSETTVTLTDGTAQGVFYAAADTTCSGGSIGSLALAIGGSTAQFRYRDTKAEVATLSASDGGSGLDDATLAVTVGPDRLDLAGPSPIRAGDCTAYTITSRDTDLTAANVLGLTTVNLTDDTATGEYFSDAACTTSITQTTIAGGSNSRTIYYRDPVKENVVLTATDAAGSLTLASDTLSVAVGPRSINLAGPTPVLSGSCQLYTVTIRDFAGTESGVLSATTVTLTDGTAQGVFYAAADTSCSGGSIGSLSLAVNGSTAQFRYRDTKAEVATLSASDGGSGLDDATLAVTVGPDRLDLAGPTPIRAGDCTAYTITSRDTDLTAANVLSTTTVNLTDDTATGDYFSDAACTTSITQTTIASGSNSRTIYYRDPVKENVVLTATDAAGSLTLASDTLAVSVGPRSINLTGASPVLSGTCQLYTVTIRDFSGIESGVLSATTVTLTDGTAQGVFYAAADTSCSGGSIGSLTLAVNASTAQFRYRDTKAEVATLSASDGGSGLDDATLAVTVGPDRLDLAGPTPIRAGDCTAYTITSRDTDLTAANVLGITTVNLTDDTATGEYFSDAACTTSITQTTITSGSNNRTIYYRDPVKETVTLTATDPAGSLTLASDSLSVAVGPRSINLTGPTPVLSGTCQLYTVTIRDFAGTESGVLSATTVTLTDGSAQGVFYAAADTSCSGGSIGSLSLAVNGSTAQFRYRDTKAEVATLSASDGGSGLNDATLAVTVGPDRLDLAGPTPIRAGDCTAYTITSRDTDLTAANVLTTTTVDLSEDSATGGFYSDAACSAPITQTTIALGSNVRTVYFWDTISQDVIMTAQDNASVLAGDTLSTTVGPKQIVITGTQPIRASDCELYTVATQDAENNLSGVVATTTINLADGSAQGVFYQAADTTCSGASISSLAFNAGETSKGFRYRNLTAESLSFSASDGASGMDDATFALAVGPSHFSLQGRNGISWQRCYPYVITARDGNNTAAAVLSDVSLNLSDGLGSGLFFASADTTCSGAPVADVLVPTGSNAVTVQYMNSSLESVVLNADDQTAYLLSGTRAVEVGADRLQITGSSPIRSGECLPYTVTSIDSNGDPQNVLADVSISIDDGAGLGAFYAAADATCSLAAVTSQTLAANSNNIIFHYRNTTAQTVTLSSDDGADLRDSATLSVILGPDRLDLEGGTVASIGDCVPYTVRARDTALNVANVLTDTTVNLDDGAGQGQFFASTDLTCSGSAMTSGTILAGQSTLSVRYRNLSSESVTLSAVDPTAYLAQDTLAVEVSGQFLQLSGPSPIRASECSLYTVEARDHLGNPQAALTDSSLSLTDGTAVGDFYAAADISCSGSIVTSATLTSGQSTTQFRYRSPSAQTLTLTVDDGANGRSPGTLSVTVGPDRLRLTSVNPVVSGECTLVTVTARDSLLVAANVTSAVTVDLDDSAATGQIFAAADTTCSGGSVSSVVIASGQQTSQFRYRSLSAETAAVSAADSAAALLGDTYNLNIGPSRIVASVVSHERAGQCLELSIVTQDENSVQANLLVDKTILVTSTSPDLEFFTAADTTCSGAQLTSLLVPVGANQATVRFRNRGAETATITVEDQDGIMSSSSVNHTSDASRFVLSGSTVVPAGRCQLYTIRTRDELGNNANVTADVTATVIGTTASGLFYDSSDSSCGGSPITEVVISNGTSTKAFRYRNLAAESNTLTVDDGVDGLIAASRTVQTGPGRLTISGPASIEYAECRAFSIEASDLNSQAATVLTDLTIDLSDGAQGGAFYSAADAGCTGTVISQTVMVTGESSQTVHYKNLLPKSLVLNADDATSALVSGTHALDIIDSCPTDFKVEPLQAGSPVTQLLAGQRFHVRVTAVNSSDVIQTCLSGSKTLTWTMNGGSAASMACGETSLGAEAPSETSLVFTNGVAETTLSNAVFKALGAASIEVSDGLHEGQSQALTVAVGPTCQIQLRSGQNGGGSIVTAQTLDLNRDGASVNDHFTVYAAGYDAFGHFTADQTVEWSGSGVVSPWEKTTQVQFDTATVYGVQSGSGTLTADFDGGDGSTGEKTKTVSVTVTDVNGEVNWTASTQDSALSALLGSSNSRRVRVWNTAAEGGTWRTSGAQSWAQESFSPNLRGSRSRFPSKVILNLTDVGLDVIDATNNHLFMRLTAGTGHALDSSFGGLTDVSALNGVVYVALRASSSSGAVIALDFKNDRVIRIDSSGWSLWTGGGLANRNAAASWVLQAATPSLVGNGVRGLATVTASAVDLVAVATDSGLTVIQDQSGGLSSQSLATTNPVLAAALSSTGTLYFSELATGLHRSSLSIPLSGSLSIDRTYNQSTAAELPVLNLTQIRVAPGASDLQVGQNLILATHALGLTVIHEHSTLSSSRAKTISYLGGGLVHQGFGGALLLDGVNDVLSIPSGGLALGPVHGTAFAIEMRIRPEASMSTGTHVLYSRGSGAGQLTLSIVDGRLEFSYQLGVVVHRLQSPVLSWPVGEWIHLAAILNGSGLQTWINGADRQTLAVDLSTASIADSVAQVGSQFNGTIDELRISKVARYASATFVPASSPFIPDSDTVSLYHFDDESGSNAQYADTQAQVIATLSGGGWWVTPALHGRSLQVVGLAIQQTALSGGTVSGTVVTSGTNGAMTELTGLQSRSSWVRGRSRDTVNAVSVDILNVTNSTVFDSIIGTENGGLQLFRRAE